MQFCVANPYGMLSLICTVGCGWTIVGLMNNLFSFKFKQLPQTMRCNHERALQLYLESFDPNCQFKGVACESQEQFTEQKCKNEQNLLGLPVTPLAASQQLFLSTQVANSLCNRHIKVFIETMHHSPIVLGDIALQFMNAQGTVEAPMVLGMSGRVVPGGSLTGIVSAQTPFLDIKKVMLKYTPYCLSGHTACTKSMTIKAVVLGTINDKKVSSSCGPQLIAHGGQWVTLDLSITACEAR